MRRFLVCLAVAAGLFAVLTDAALAEKRVALVIGNGNYKDLKPLRNPQNDAADVAAALRDVGFDVISGVDLPQAAMQALTTRFVREARQADVSLIYYSGHGFQLAAQNYLVPVDAALRSADDVARKTIELRSLMQQLEGSKGIHLVFLDACRNNPFAGKADIAGVQNGLARIGNAAGFMIAFATQPDNVAFDGGGRNSPFTQAVLSHLPTRGQDIASMMIAVRKDVLAATGGYQVPWENSSLTRQFAFAPGAASALSPETQLWQLAAGARDQALLRIYLDRYPEGEHRPDARQLLAAIPSPSVSRSTAPSEPVAEDTLWDLAKRGRMRALVEFYLARNPDGRHASEARELLGALPRIGEVDEPSESVCERLATHPRDATANIAGTPLADLAKNAEIAIDACRKSAVAHPEMPHYIALLARALTAAGQRDEAIRLYRDAAERGNLRALVSLGLITEAGDGVRRDPKAAMAYYEKAAAGGSPDGAINLAVGLMNGTGIARNARRAIELLTKASQEGSAIATYNLGVLAQQNVTGNPGAALGYFQKTTELGDARGFLAGAILLDKALGVKKDAPAAAGMLLQGVAADGGEALNALATDKLGWSQETVAAVQAKLKKGGYYEGPVNGRAGAPLRQALEQWRATGSLDIGQGG